MIALSTLNHENWSLIYQFIRSIVHSSECGFDRIESLLRLQSVASLRLERGLIASETQDAFELRGEKFDADKISRLTPRTCFSIIYRTSDDDEDYASLVPFFLLHHDFQNSVTLGVDVGDMSLASQNDFKFKMSNFLILIEDCKPRCGNRSLYLINEKKIDKETGELTYVSHTRVTSLAGRSQMSLKHYEGDSSRRFLPLIAITESNYIPLFGADAGKVVDTKETSFLKSSVEKLLATKEVASTVRRFSSDDMFMTSSLFGQWLWAGYIFSYSLKELRGIKDAELSGVRKTIQLYENSIFELVQNIIFHGGKSGLLYCIFDKKKNMSCVYADRIPRFEDYREDTRFVRIGIFDYNDQGIVDTYNNNMSVKGDDVTLRDFFDVESIATTGLSTLELRYAARLGIKTFVKTVINQGGYFRVESNTSAEGGGRKQMMQTEVVGSISSLGKVSSYVFAKGTHYEIVVPVIPQEEDNVKSVPLQRSSVLRNLFLAQRHSPFSTSNVIESIPFPFGHLQEIIGTFNKDDQKNGIIRLSNNLAKKRQVHNENEVALDFGGRYADPNLVFKIIACLQLRDKHGFERIFLVNVPDSFVTVFLDVLSLVVKYRNGTNVWSRTSAIVIVSINLQVRLVWGKNAEELRYVNREIQKYYCNYFFAPHDTIMECDGKFVLKENLKRMADRLIAPYDIMITTRYGTTLFESFLLRLLKRGIISQDMGCLVNHENTYIGNKIIVRNYYEADMLFQNNFFIERFSYLISRSLKEELDKIRKGRKTKAKRLVLLGYQHYSEYLLKSVKRMFADEDVLVVIGVESEKKSGTEYVLDFIVDEAECGAEDTLMRNGPDFVFATIVPIGSTLSTNDKVVALFRQWYERKRHVRNPDKDYEHLDDQQFFYNHCVIIVRDSDSPVSTSGEQVQKWNKDGLSIQYRTVTTSYKNARLIHYNTLVASSSGKNAHNWVRRLNSEISFPSNWWEESYVNYTENVSINSQNLMGFPQAEIVDESEHTTELHRLYEFRYDICKGHLDVRGSHHRFYVDTETFVKREGTGLKNWLVSLYKTKQYANVFGCDKLNVLVTPNADRESDFVRMVNEKLFGDAAMIVCLDVRSWRNNMVYKLSYLKDISPENVQYHYVDHALLTGGTYNKTKSYLFSILGHREVPFSSVITVVNRLPHVRMLEIKKDGVAMLAYVNMLYPANEDAKGCKLCELMSYYDDLRDKTVLDGCAAVIKSNKDKLAIENIHRRMSPYRAFNRRVFLRLVMTHELYYRIAETRHLGGVGHLDYSSETLEVEKKLDTIYAQMTSRDVVSDPSCISATLSSMIDEWFDGDNLSYNADLDAFFKLKLDTDKRISFLKGVSSPPLSQYITIRKYAYVKLLKELRQIIAKPRPEFNDLRIAKSILKSLSFLKSNALVRSDVIIGVWTLLSNVIDNLDNERERWERMLVKTRSLKSRLSWEIRKGRSGGMGDLFSTDIPKLEKQREAILQVRSDLKYELSKTCDKASIVRDFGRDVQFFVKNAILDDEAKATFLGELLRRGNEMTGFDKLRISATSLSLDTERSSRASVPTPRKLTGDENFLFSKSFGQDAMVDKEYVHFLVWLFYDNTTIIRRTLDNFEKEISKDDRFKRLFYSSKNELYEISTFKSNASQAKHYLLEKIPEEYYYHSFRPYLNNDDGIDFVGKMVYVIYAKLKLEDLTSRHHKTMIETDTRDLMEIFAAIMGADKAFLTINKTVGNRLLSGEIRVRRRIYPVSLYGKSDYRYENTWDYGKWSLEDDFYTGQIHQYKQGKEIVSPVVPIYKLREEKGERRHLGAHSLGVYLIPDNEGETCSKNEYVNGAAKGTVVASITFLFDDNNPAVSEEKTFRIRLQESSRLMLLLKNQVNKYVIDYLLKEKAFDLWESKFWHVRRFEKIYANSAHRFNSVYDEMDEFDHLDLLTIGKLANTWYFLANETISFVYSNIERNADRKDGKHYMSVLDDYIIDQDNTFGATFNRNFIGILVALLHEGRWKTVEGPNNEIIVNGQSVETFMMDDALASASLPCNKHLMRTFVALCVNNSLAPVSRHGHRGEREVKRVIVTISKFGISIEDKSLNTLLPSESRKKTAMLFQRKRRLIEEMNCEEYSSTTLTSLQGFVNYMRDRGWHYGCDFGYGEEGDFFVKIRFNV